MNQPTCNCCVTITNPQGLHARPADLFVRRAQRFVAQIVVVKGTDRADGKSILDILTLAAVAGTTLVIEATGDDAQAAIDSLRELVESDFAVDDNEASGGF